MEKSNEKIRIGILGYGNLGKGAELAVSRNPDMELTAVYTRRDPSALTGQLAETRILPVSDLDRGQEPIDVLLLCGGSACDLPVQSQKYAAWYNIVDSYDNHAQIPEHFRRVDAAARQAETAALISAGWDPGLFSLNRLISEAVLPGSQVHTFWGRGVSQGHSDAIRTISGVIDARQYTVPVEAAMKTARRGSDTAFTPRDKHIRECYVVTEPGADLTRIEEEIVQMPAYFADYNTIVHFVSEEELAVEHSDMPHGGFVIASGKTGGCSREVSHRQTYEFSLKLASNPEFTASVLAAYARAVFHFVKKGEYGCRTVFEVPPYLLLPESAETLIKRLL